VDRPGIHGNVFVPEFGKGLTSNGGDGIVTAFDIKTMKATRKLECCGVSEAIPSTGQLPPARSLA